MTEGTQGLFPGAENMVSDKSRSVGPRSTRIENRLHVNGKPMELALRIQGNKVCTAEVSSSGGAPCGYPRAAMTPVPLHFMESRASLEHHPQTQQGYARTVQSTPSLSRVL